MHVRVTMACLWTLHISGILLSCVGGQEARDLEQLFTDKIWPCNPYIRPVLNQSHQLNVTIGLNIVAITDFDEVHETLSFTAWLDILWTDQLLSWNPDQYGGVKEVIPPVDKIWHPNMVVANTMDTFSPLTASTDLVKVNHRGIVNWTPGASFHIYCEVDTTIFPFDAQECNVELLIWDYSMDLVDLNPSQDFVGTTAFRANGEWVIIYTTAYKEIRFPNKVPKPWVVAKLRFKRRPQFVLVNIILPTAFLTILNSFVFLIPSDSGEKISFSVTILLAYGVLMSYITGMLPQTSKTTSSLSLYMIGSLAVSSTFVCLAILITRLYKKNETESPVPFIVARITRRVERLLCRRKYDEKPVHAQCDSPENHTTVSKVSSVCNGVLNGEAHERCHGYRKDHVISWKRVSNALDLILFLITFPSITIASAVLMVEDFMASQHI